MFFTTIARQLTDILPALKRHIYEAVARHNSIADLTHPSLRDQWEQLILQPLSMLKGDPCPPPLVLVVDALDECDGDERDDDRVVQEILQLFTEAKSLGGVRLRVFVTSRPETPIRHGFSNIPEIVHHDCGTLAGAQQRYLSADTPPRPRDDYHLVVQYALSHAFPKSIFNI